MTQTAREVYKRVSAPSGLAVGADFWRCSARMRLSSPS